MTDIKLLQIAAEAREMAYAPYSKYKVGAALLCKDGSVFTGCNVENLSYGATICAERTAMVKAISEGKQGFSKLAVSVSGDEIGMPCGICRQFIDEFAGDDFTVICGNSQNQYQIYPFSGLLPASFRASILTGREPHHDNGKS